MLLSLPQSARNVNYYCRTFKLNVDVTFRMKMAG